MKKLFLTIALAIISNTAMAVWTDVGGTDSPIVYAELSTIRKVDNKVKMWSMYDYKTSQVFKEGMVLSVKMFNEFDCNEEQIRVLTSTIHEGNMGLGKIIKYIEQQGAWMPVPPGSFAGTLLKVACGKK